MMFCHKKSWTFFFTVHVYGPCYSCIPLIDLMCLIHIHECGLSSGAMNQDQVPEVVAPFSVGIAPNPLEMLRYTLCLSI